MEFPTKAEIELREARERDREIQLVCIGEEEEEERRTVIMNYVKTMFAHGSQKRRRVDHLIRHITLAHGGTWKETLSSFKELVKEWNEHGTPCEFTGGPVEYFLTFTQ